jgi:predicted acetyltransferase
MTWTIRPATRDEVPLVERALSRAFGGDPSPDDGPHFEAMLELDRTRCAFEGDELIGTLGVLTLELAVPGASVGTAGTTMITVRPTHRRRGLLRTLMREHLQEIRERGEPLAALWASESSIYSRFGYGPAADLCEFEVECAHSRFAAPVDAPGRCRTVEPDEAAKLLPEVYESVWRGRPGAFARSSAWWEHRCLRDPPGQRGGATGYRFAVYEEGERPRGYVQYRIRARSRPSGLPDSDLRVVELFGADPAARAALWRFALDVDLNRRLHAWNQPADCELPWLLADRRRAVCSLRDSLWVRVLDVPAALAARSYASQGSLVLEVHDSFEPASGGRFRLEVGPDGATCETTSATAEIALDASDLGAAYLGGRSLRALARAGRVQGSAEALAQADRMFAWDPAAWCPEVF